MSTFGTFSSASVPKRFRSVFPLNSGILPKPIRDRAKLAAICPFGGQSRHTRTRVFSGEIPMSAVLQPASVAARPKRRFNDRIDKASVDAAVGSAPSASITPTPKHPVQSPTCGSGSRCGPWIQEAGRLITAKEAEAARARPGEPWPAGPARASRTSLYAADTAHPARAGGAGHRSLSGQRCASFCLRNGAYPPRWTGEKVTMSVGALSLLRRGLHDHGNPSERRLDGGWAGRPSGRVARRPSS